MNEAPSKRVGSFQCFGRIIFHGGRGRHLAEEGGDILGQRGDEGENARKGAGRRRDSKQPGLYREGRIAPKRRGRRGADFGGAALKVIDGKVAPITTKG